MISYLCRTYKKGNAGNFRSEPFTERADAENCAKEQSRRGFFSSVWSTGHRIGGSPVADIYLCEWAPDPKSEEILERAVAAAGVIA